ncbi:lipase [Periconia macrospinosa]|uniref:Lipase n=1 Tax=Periconia macrospinosa TaxID=97972 RepID=A0A2V1E4B5_9PLEO|nr:lipase [Periconia macrospinosa]
MAPNIHIALIGISALCTTLLAVLWEPAYQFILDTSVAYGIPVIPRLIKNPIAIDVARDIQYIGSRSADIEHFHNIFYAEDTSGKNRFAPPVPLLPITGSVIDAIKPGAWCPQATGDIFPFTSKIVNISENCLSLRVARSYGTKPDAKLLVVVWIHGGGHALGSGSDILYEPDGLVRQAKIDNNPLIFVSINYRLGLFGFATSKALLGARHTNVGLRDQRAALDWVRENIEIFGGDPKKVTVMGQSVGGSDISLHLTSFGGKRGVPFQQAIMMSGASGLNFNTKSDLVANNTAAIAENVGCVKNGDSQSMETLGCLRDVPFEVLTNISTAMSRAARPPFGEGFFYPTYDNDYVLDRPTELMRAGRFVKGIPIIASWVTNDGAWYASPATATDEDVLATFAPWLFGYSESTKAKLLKLYPLDDFKTMVRPEYDGPISPQYYRAAQINRDLWFTCPVIDFAWQYVKHGGKQTSNVWLYEHNSTRFTPVFETIGVPMWRVSHLSDIPYALNNQQLSGGADNSAMQLELSKKFSRRVAQFVTFGKPDGAIEDTEAWPPAFASVTGEELRGEYPSSISFKLTGGPFGPRSVTVSKIPPKETSSQAEEAANWEKIIRRCEFINSPTVRLESGV